MRHEVFRWIHRFNSNDSSIRPDVLFNNVGSGDNSVPIAALRKSSKR